MYIFVVKGVSGSGKSTRVSFLLDFLRQNGFTFSDFLFKNSEGKEKPIGILVEELNLVVIGKYYEKDGKTRFQGFDSMTGFFCGVENFSNFLKDNSDKYSFIVEGAGITDSNRFRPRFLNEIGFDKILIQYYNYKDDQKECYLKRIFDRTGKHPNKDSGWNKRNNFRGDHRFSLKEQSELNIVDCLVFEDSFDENIDDFCIKFFDFFKV